MTPEQIGQRILAEAKLVRRPGTAIPHDIPFHELIDLMESKGVIDLSAKGESNGTMETIRQNGNRVER